MPELAARLAPNWTSAAGAVEGTLEYLGAPLPRHAVMGLTGHAWHFALAERDGVAALPSGPTELDWEAMVERYGRTGFRWERHAGEMEDRDRAIAWARERIDNGIPVIGWDLHLHEHGIIYGYDESRGGWLVDDALAGQVGPFMPWDDWPSKALGRIEMFAPVEEREADPLEAVLASLDDAVRAIDSVEANRGYRGIERWADALAGDVEVDRAGNAYTLQVLQAARLDGIDYLRNLQEVFPGASGVLERAGRALQDEVGALAPLITLFPFPAGGHGNVANPGLREAAAVALRRAAGHERQAIEHLAEARDAIATLAEEG